MPASTQEPISCRPAAAAGASGSGGWPLLEPLCLQHALVGNAIADGWIAAAVLAHRECLATLDRDFVPLLPARQLVLLNP